MAGEITSANATQAMANLIAATALEPLRSNLFLARLVNRNYEAMLAEKGQSVSVPLPPSFIANNIAEAGEVQNQQKSLGSVDVTLNYHKEVTFSISDVVTALSSVDIMSTNFGAALIALAETVESDLFSYYGQFNANAAVGAGNTALTEATLDSAETTLFTAKVPASQPRYLAVSGAAYSQLRQIARFTEVQTIGSGQSILTGDFLKAKGFSVFRSQLVPKVSTTTYNLGFTRDALTMAMRRLPAPMPGTGAVVSYINFEGFEFRVIISYNPRTLQNQVTIDALYGITVLRNSFGLQVLN